MELAFNKVLFLFFLEYWYDFVILHKKLFGYLISLVGQEMLFFSHTLGDLHIFKDIYIFIVLPKPSIPNIMTFYNFKKFIYLKHVPFLTFKTRQGKLISSTL